MGAEQSQQRSEVSGREALEGSGTSAGTSKSSSTAAAGSNSKRRPVFRQHTGTSNTTAKSEPLSATASPSASELSRPPSPPLSICSDQPYVSYTNRPIGDSPKIRNKGGGSSARSAARKSYPGGAKPKRLQSASNHNIVIVKPGAKDNEGDMDPDVERLNTIPQFLPVIRDTISSSSFACEPDILERLPSIHLLNICSRLQTHYNVCATQVAADQDRLLERTKMVSNSITTQYASFVDMQKTYASYAEQFGKLRQITQQVSSCNDLLRQNIQSLETINNYLDEEDRLEPFVWRTDDSELRTADKNIKKT